MPELMYPPLSQDLAHKRRELAPDIQAAFHAFSETRVRRRHVPAKTKQLIAVAAAHITQCPYCIKVTQSGDEARSNPAGNHGGDLGRRRDAGRRCLRTFGNIDHHHERGAAAARTLSQSRGFVWFVS